MSLYARALLFAIAGAVVGAIPSPGSDCYPLFVLGLLLGSIDAYSVDNVWRKAGVLILAMAGGAAAHVAGMMAMDNWPAMLFTVPIATTILATALSLARGSLAFTVQSALGGLLGGVCAEGALSLLSDTLNDNVLNALRLAIIALGIGIVPTLLTRTCLTVNGKWRRDYPLVRATTTLGSSPNADIHVPASPEVAPVHAVVELLPGLNRRRLRHAAGGTGGHAFPATRVNGRGVTGEQWLSDGDTVQIGARAWTFHDRATRGELRLGPAVPEAWQRSVASGSRKAAEEAPAPTPDAPSPTPDAPSPTPPLGDRERGKRKLPPDPERGKSVNTPQSNRADKIISPPFSLSEGGGGWGEGASGTNARDIGRVGTRLVCTDGPYAGRVYRLGPGETRIGSHPTCAVPLPADTELAPVHARLLAHPSGGHTIEAAKTDGGTWVNGARLTGPHPLLPGDLIRVGVTVLRYQ